MSNKIAASSKTTAPSQQLGERGMCNWTAWWFSPDGDLDRKQVAEQIAALALASVRRSDSARDARDLRSLVGAIRENLDVIERIGNVQPKRRLPRKAPAAGAKPKAGLRG